MDDYFNHYPYRAELPDGTIIDTYDFHRVYKIMLEDARYYVIHKQEVYHGYIYNKITGRSYMICGGGKVWTSIDIVSHGKWCRVYEDKHEVA